ncbi:IS5/IS1182 family transposase [Streptomyces sp. NRRL S-920]|uniref:IS5/IS1182 family transposase n=1 Tax=Streptomyces sp. NRRL S-920 TaxID=1463921 RepID=UPI00068BEE4A|nr:IS5/IS1182 family transposase [Streptomyces sp. NRRL S-920]
MYPSDLSDARWELIEPVLSAWRYERHGRALGFARPARHDLREIMNAILYVDRTGVQWAYLPHDTARRAQPGAVGLRDRRAEHQDLHEHPRQEPGHRRGQEIVGRKRSIITDTLGLLLAVLVTAAGVQDSTAGRVLLDQAAADHPRLRKVWVDGGYRSPRGASPARLLVAQCLDT